MSAAEAPRTEILVGYGSLLSKRGLARDGTAPRIHRAWAFRLGGRRALRHPVRQGRRLAMDAELDEARVLGARALPGFVTGPVAGPLHPRPWTATEPSFEALGLEIDAADWIWFAAREHFPPGLPEALVRDAGRAGTSIAAHLGSILAASGVEGYPDALFARYRGALRDPAEDAFFHAYLPWPVHLPRHDDGDLPLPAEWAVVCAVPRKRHPAVRAHEAATGPQRDPASCEAYYLDCVLGLAHGIDVADIQDEAFERSRPGFAARFEEALAAERRPLADFLTSRGPAAASAHGMHPVQALIPFDDALRLVETVRVARPRAESLPLARALGRVLAEDLVAAFDQPDAPKCAMDGYAVRAADTEGADEAHPRRLRLVGERVAGGPAGPAVGPGTCVQVATGALLPAGADAVVPVERTRAEGDGVLVVEAHAPGRHVLAQGGDFAAGATLVGAGHRLGPAQLSAAAALGRTQVSVTRRPRVAVAATGTEVVSPGATRPLGAVYDSNSTALAALAARLGGHVTRFEPVPDDEAALEAFLRDVCARSEVVLVSGGTSAGARDLLAPLLSRLGRVVFHGVRMRPGKPVLLAEVGSCLVVGLPGYPASCVLTAEVFAAPLLLRLSGRAFGGPVQSACTLADEVTSKDGWTTLVPVAVTPDGRAVPVFHGSSAVSSIGAADGYVVMEEHVTVLHAGTSVVVQRFH